MSHEISDHYRGKNLLVVLHGRRGYSSLLEMGCDVLSFRTAADRNDFILSEYERSLRNLIPNCHRNLRRSQCQQTRYLIAVPHDQMRRAARNMLQRHFPANIARKFAIALLSDIERAIQR